MAEEIKLQVIPLFDEFLEKHKLSEVRKKNYWVVKRGLQRYELYVRMIKWEQKDFTLYIDDVTSDTLCDVWGFFRERIPILPALSGRLRCDPRSANAATAWKEHFIGLLFADSDVLLLV